MYFQLSGNLKDFRVRLNGAEVCRVDSTKLRAHVHNFPLFPPGLDAAGVVGFGGRGSEGVYGQPPILFSWWAEVGEEEGESTGFDIMPEKVLPMLLRMIGTSEELRRFVVRSRRSRTLVPTAPSEPTSGKAIKGSGGVPSPTSSSSSQLRLSAFVRSLSEMSALELLRLLLRRVDFSFCVRLMHMRGRLGGLRLECEEAEISRDFEFQDNSGFVSGKIRRAFLGYDALVTSPPGSSLSGGPLAMRAEHEKWCSEIAAERASGSSSGESQLVLPFAELSNLSVSLALRTDLLLTPFTDQDFPKTIGAELVRIFVSGSGARLCWSPALQRAVRQLLTRADALVRATRTWKESILAELAREGGMHGKNAEGVKTVNKILNSVMLLNRKATVVFNLSDMQTNLHAVMAADVPSSSAAVGGAAGGGEKAEPGTLTPAAFRAFLRRIGASDDVSPSPSPVNQPPSPSPSGAGDAEKPRRSGCGCGRHKKARDDCGIGRSVSFRASGVFPGLAYDERGVTVSQAEATLAAVTLAPPLLAGVPRQARELSGVFGSLIGGLEVKPRGSQLVMVTERCVVELQMHRKPELRSGAAVETSGSVALVNVSGSVAPTSLRGLLWLENSRAGAATPSSVSVAGRRGGVWGSGAFRGILRSVVQITKFNGHVDAELFPFRSLGIRVVIPKTLLAADSEAFFIVLGVVQDCLLYRGSGAASAGPGLQSTAAGAGGSSASLGAGGEALLRELIQASSRGRGSAAVVFEDDLRGGGGGRVRMEYKLEQVGLNLINRERVAVRLTLQDFIGSHSIELNEGREMTSEFELKDALLVCAGTDAGGEEQVVLRAANQSVTSGIGYADSGGGAVMLRIRGRDKFVSGVLGKEWRVYDSVFLALAPLVIDISQELFDELYEFFFPGQRGTAGAGATNSAEEAEEECLFKYFRVSPIDCIVSYRGKRISINMLSIILKPFVKKRKMTTWRKFLQAWGSIVGQQVVGSVMTHPFKRKKGLQETLKEKFQPGKIPPGKLLFGKFALVV
jgi:hypothetical protein